MLTLNPITNPQSTISNPQFAGLTSKAMLVSLSISVWTARKHDKKVSREVAAQHQTTEAAGRYNKNLLPFDAPSFERVKKAASAARQEFYGQTLAWSDEGFRILPSANYWQFRQKMQEAEREYNTARDAFLAEYPQLRMQAQTLLNGLFNPEDYPMPEQLERKFGFVQGILPLPDAGDFRCQLSSDEVAVIREQIEEAQGQAIKQAMRDLYERVYACVSHMADKLKDPDAIFRDSLVKNLEEIYNLMPRLNLTGDPELERIYKQIGKHLIGPGLQPQQLRDSQFKRTVTAAEANRIANDLAAFMGQEAA